jgi:hypothetical protein
MFTKFENLRHATHRLVNDKSYYYRYYLRQTPKAISKNTNPSHRLDCRYCCCRCCFLFFPSKNHSNTFRNTAFPPVSMTSPWQGIIRSKSHLFIRATDPPTLLRSFAVIYHTNRLCHVAGGGLAEIKGENNLVKMPELGDCPVREYCSLAGKLKMRSAWIMVLLGLCKKTISLFPCPSTYSISISRSNSSDIWMSCLLDLVRMCENWISFWSGLLCRFSNRPSGAMISASGKAFFQAVR